MGVWELDLFVTFRWMLATICTVYAAVCIWQSLWGWLNYFSSSRQTAVLGRYTVVLLLRLKIRRFAGELLQIAAWLLVLGLLVYLHYGWGHAT